MKKRILFVEDNPVLLAMYAMTMEAERERWEVVTMGNACQALGLFDQGPFDVVVSDLRMPGMDGVEFLREVRQRLPACSRIIVSGLSDQEEVVRSLNSTHQFLAKPLDFKLLRATLARIGGLDAYLRDEKLKALVGRVTAFPSFPTLYVEITQELSSPEPSLQAVGEIIGKDPAMTAKMLQLVNSAAVGLSRKVSGPFEAVQFLGINTVQSLVLSAHIFSCFEQTRLKGLSVEQLWTHALRTGRLARTILQRECADAADVDDAYIGGMLHDMGKLILAESVPEAYEQALAMAAERGCPFEEAETELLGATHAGVAAYLLGLWGLPAGIVEAVAFHHSPGRSQIPAFGPLAAVHVANLLDHEMFNGRPGAAALKWDPGYLRAVGIEDRLETWRGVARDLFKTPSGGSSDE